MNKLFTAGAFVLLSTTFAFANTTGEELLLTTTSDELVVTSYVQSDSSTGTVIVTTGSVELTTGTVVTTGAAELTTGSVELTTGTVVTTGAVVTTGTLDLTGAIHNMTGECLSGLNFVNDSVRGKIHTLMITLDEQTASKVKYALKTMNYNVSGLNAKYTDALAKMYTKRTGDKAIARSEKIISVLSKYLADNKKVSVKTSKVLKGMVSYATLKLIELKDLTNEELLALILN